VKLPARRQNSWYSLVNG